MTYLKKAIKRWLIREDEQYEFYNRVNPNLSLAQKLLYLLLYLLPGIFAVAIINNKNIYQFLLSLTGWSDELFQYWCLILVTFGWHIILPIGVLRYIDKLSWQETWRYLNLNTIDWKGCLIIMPIVLLFVFFLSLPYTKYIGEPIESWLASFPILQVPDYSIFCCYEKIYGYPTHMLIFLFIGNFLGEELYYRGYLLKKTTFLGKWNVVIHTFLFTIYHFWQIPQTYAFFGLAFFFPLLMIWRKNLYVPILFHLFWNVLWPLFMSYFYY